MDATLLDTTIRDTGNIPEPITAPGVASYGIASHGAALRVCGKPRPLSLTKKLVFSLIPLCCLLASAEFAARLLWVDGNGGQRFAQIEQIIVYLGNKPGQSIFEPDAACYWRLKPNVTLPDDRGEAWGGKMSNSHGLRSREVSLADAMARRRILCFGDSSTFSFGVRFEDAWPNQLQQILDQEHPGVTEVLNAGVPGQTSYQGRQRLTRELSKWKPDVAVITFGNNDGWRWDNLEDKDHARRAAGQSFEFLNCSRGWQWLMSQRRQSAQARATNEQLEWAGKATWNYLIPEDRWTPRVSIDDFSDNLRAMVAECRQHGCEPILVVWPDQRQFLGHATWRPPYQAAMRQVAAETKSECLDLVPLFEDEGSRAVDWFIPNDVVHVDGVGNRFVAETVAQRILPKGDSGKTEVEDERTVRQTLTER